MHTIDIYRGSDVFVTIKPDDSSTQIKRVKAENEIRLQFELDHHADFTINDYADVFEERYVVFTVPIVTKVSKFTYQYNMTMKAEGFGLERAQFLFLGSNNALKESDFTLMGTPEDFLNLVVQNANRVSSGWLKGQVIIAEYKNLTFSMDNCYTAISRIAEAFDTEFFLEGKKVHLTARQRNIPIAFRHGRNRGLYEIKRTAVDTIGVITRLYAFGSENNLPVDYRSPTHQEIIDGGILNPPPTILSKRLLMPHGEYFIERNIEKYGIIEATQIFEDIYPHRTGKVTSVNAGNIYEFSDATMDFNVNSQLLPGVSAKITFNTGQLAGYTFDIQSYDNTNKKFIIIKNKDEKVLDIPNIDIRPAIGDTYVLTDIKMPEGYLVNAEALLKATAENYLLNNSEPLLAYQVTLDPVFMRREKIVPNIGDVVNIKDDELGVSRNIRIISTTRNIVDEDQWQIELSDKVPTSPLATILNGIQNNDRSINQINRQLQNTLNRRVPIIANDLPSTGVSPDFSSLVIENSTGRVFRQF